MQAGQGTALRRQPKSLREGEAPSRGEVEEVLPSASSRGPPGHNPRTTTAQGLPGLGLISVLETARARSYCYTRDSRG